MLDFAAFSVVDEAVATAGNFAEASSTEAILPTGANATDNGTTSDHYPVTIVGYALAEFVLAGFGLSLVACDDRHAYCLPVTGM